MPQTLPKKCGLFSHLQSNREVVQTAKQSTQRDYMGISWWRNMDVLKQQLILQSGHIFFFSAWWVNIYVFEKWWRLLLQHASDNSTSDITVPFPSNADTFTQVLLSQTAFLSNTYQAIVSIINIFYFHRSILGSIAKQFQPMDWCPSVYLTSTFWLTLCNLTLLSRTVSCFS